MKHFWHIGQPYTIYKAEVSVLDQCFVYYIRKMSSNEIWRNVIIASFIFELYIIGYHIFIIFRSLLFRSFLELRRILDVYFTFWIPRFLTSPLLDT